MRKFVAVLLGVAGLGVLLVTLGYAPRILKGLHRKRVVSAERFEPEYFLRGQYTRVTDGILDLIDFLEVGTPFGEEMVFGETLVPLRWKGHLPAEAKEQGVTRRFVIFTGDHANDILQRNEDGVPHATSMPFEVEGTVRHRPIFGESWPKVKERFSIDETDGVVFLQYGLAPPSNLKLAFFILVGGVLIYSSCSLWKTNKV